MNKKYKFKFYLYVLIYLLIGWTAITITIMAFMYPELTETQLFLSIPKAFVLNFN